MLVTITDLAKIALQRSTPKINGRTLRGNSSTTPRSAEILEGGNSIHLSRGRLKLWDTFRAEGKGCNDGKPTGNLSRISAILVASGMGFTSLTGVSAAAENSDTRTADVSLGDSYIAGEGARWAGNAQDPNWFTAPLAQARGGDRLTSRENTLKIPGWNVSNFSGKSHDAIFPDNTYGRGNAGATSESNQERPGCHRSDAAEIMALGAREGKVNYNFACSGATTEDIILEEGARTQFNKERGESAQITRLRQLKVNKGVKIDTVVISIGGNDLNLSGVVESCIKEYITLVGSKKCNMQGNGLASLGDSKYQEVQKKIQRVLAAVKREHSGRIILQSYPNPFPTKASDLRGYSSNVPFSRYQHLGVPLDDGAFEFLTKVSSNLNDTLRAAAHASGVSFLDTLDAVKGHEVGSKQTELQEAAPNGDLQHPANRLEWMRWVDTTDVIPLLSGPNSSQRKQESLHPNYFGTQSETACLMSFKSKLRDKSEQYDGKCMVSANSDPRATQAAGVTAR